MATLGPQLTELLNLAWEKGFTVSSDYARSNAVLVALAASEGLITNLGPSGYGRTWLITMRGLDFLQEDK